MYLRSEARKYEILGFWVEGRHGAAEGSRTTEPSSVDLPPPAPSHRPRAAGRHRAEKSHRFINILIRSRRARSLPTSNATKSPKQPRGRSRKNPVTPGPSDAPARDKTDKPYRANLGWTTLGPPLVTRAFSKSKEKPETEEEEGEEEEQEEEKAEEEQENIEEQEEDTEEEQEGRSSTQPANLRPLNHWQPHFERKNARFLQSSRQQSASSPRNAPPDAEATPARRCADSSVSRTRTRRREPSTPLLVVPL
ncbi:hypothetical protein GGX14DRAFT_387394 [Mycena pura]|uniref:Uncharacterized protein n=1 Tax=Mycena pura TaxID=153505 RepID=A0AAD6YLA4_9AGAR|nr:hypothetical protein GGX14DRAFT_387394 [Mycena pura]